MSLAIFCGVLHEFLPKESSSDDELHQWLDSACSEYAKGVFHPPGCSERQDVDGTMLEVELDLCTQFARTWEELLDPEVTASVQSWNLMTLASYYEEGWGVVEVDLEQAFALFCRAAVRQEPSVMISLSLAWYLGRGVAKNRDEALRCLRSVLELKKQHKASRFKESLQLATSENTDTWLKAEAAYEVASFYYSGRGVKQDREVALKWFRKSASENHAQAMHSLFNHFLLVSREGLQLDEALHWFYVWEQTALQKQANQSSRIKSDIPELQRRYDEGDDSVEDELGRALIENEEQEKLDKCLVDSWAAASYLAREDGDREREAYGVKVLATAYYDAFGRAEDRSQSLDLLHQAAELGNPDAQFLLGLAYREGVLVPCDEMAALKWFEAASRSPKQILEHQGYPSFRPKS